MFNWFRRNTAEAQESNIRKTLAMLIDVSNEAAATIDHLGGSTTLQRTTIHELQDSLIGELAGPIPMDEIRRRIVEPALQSPGTSQSARLAVASVFDSASAVQQH
ncbi:MAG TPA: hypothetical protein VF277_08455 [Steroidobacteraceae bacterium]